MLELIENYFSFEDERGSIKGLVNFGDWQEFNIIESIAGLKRGGHYHKETIELFIILDGKITIHLENINTGETSEQIVKKDDVFMIKPYVKHTFVIDENSKWINVLSKKMDEDNKDIYI